MSTGDIVVEPGGTGTRTVESKGLKGGSLGLLSSVVVGMASTAPAYSLAAVLGPDRRQRALLPASRRRRSCCSRSSRST